MSWKNAVNYTKSIWQKNDVHAQDDNLPLGARIGGMLQLQKSPFIRAISNGSFIEMPTDAQTIIKAISRVNLNLSGSLYRYYLQTGDGILQADNGRDKEIFLQLYVNTQGEVTEAIYCSQLTRLIPESDEDQRLYMGVDGYGLGDQHYSLWRFQLEELGYGEADLYAAFGDDDEIEYQRDAGSSDQEFIAPFTGSEVRLDDAQGEQGLKQEIYFMPYRRTLKDTSEYLFIATEFVQSRNGDSSKREIHVDFMVGIAVDLERILVQ